MVADMVLDQRAASALATELYPAVMRSAARCTYNEVQEVLDGEDVPHRNALRPHLRAAAAPRRRRSRSMRERARGHRLRPARAKVELDEDGLPAADRAARAQGEPPPRRGVHARRERGGGGVLPGARLPTVYRFHGEPDEDKLEAFAALARAHGFSFAARRRAHLQRAERSSSAAGGPPRAAGAEPAAAALDDAGGVLARATWGTTGSARRTTCTSPRPSAATRTSWCTGCSRPTGRGASGARSGSWSAEMDELRRMAEHSSERERAAMKCEREVNALYACILMKDRVGEEFPATVSSITDFGFFVELDLEHVEGLVRAEDLGPGHRLVVGALVWSSGRRVQVGQALTVRLAGVNVQRRQMDFDVVAFAGERPSRRRGGAERVEVPPPERERGVQRAQRPGRAEERHVAGAGRPGDARASGRPGRGNRGNDRTKPDAAAGRPANLSQQQGRRAEQRGSRSTQSQPSRPVQRGGPDQGLAKGEARSGKHQDQRGGSTRRRQGPGGKDARPGGPGQTRRRRR